MTEIWKINIDHPFYEISNIGKIRSIDRISITKRGIKKPHKGKELSLHKSNSGYIFTVISEYGIRKSVFIHRMVLSTFKPNNNTSLQVNHIDGIKDNNELDNLEWCTSSENHTHRFDILKQSGINKGRIGKLNKGSKPIKQLDLNGNLLKIWDCAPDYGRSINRLQIKDIYSVTSGKQKTAYGYKWKYV